MTRLFSIRRNRRTKRLNHNPGRITGILFLTIILMQSLQCHSQARSLSYEILRNGNKVGTLNFTQSVISGMNYLQLESDVKTRFIFTFTAHSKEEAIYSNGILLRSSIFRQMNGREKANKQHQVLNNQYVIHVGKNSAITQNYPITYNMLSLYTIEPININKVYSDNFETFIAIQKVEMHKYRISLPDGNYNYYYYKDGILNMVEVHHSLYSATIVLAR